MPAEIGVFQTFGSARFEQASATGRRSPRPRTAPSSGRRWRPWRRPSPCAAAPSGSRSGRSRGCRAAAARWPRSSVLPRLLAAAPPMSSGISSPIPHAVAAGEERLDAHGDGGLGERDVAAAGEHLGEVAAADAAVVVLDRVVGLRRHPFAFVGERRVQDERSVLQADPGGDHLERRPRHEALLVGPRQQRVDRRPPGGR